mgnify:CR=1 FL=1
MITTQKLSNYSKLLLKITLFIFIGVILGAIIFLMPKHKNILPFVSGGIAAVGTESIDKKTIDYQIKVDKCYGSENQSEGVALIKIINNLLEKEVLLSAFDIKITEKDLEDKSGWVDTNTKAPDILKCVKEVFGNDRKNYLALYISPTVVNPTLYNNFYFSPEIHKEELNEIKEIKAKIDSGQRLEDFPNYSSLEVPKEITLPDTLEPYQDQFKESVLSKVVKQLKPNQIWPEIIEDEYSYMIVRLLKEDENQYYLDGVTVAKKEFDPWFKDWVTRNIKIFVFDSQIAQDLKTNYSQIWWVALIKEK